MNTSTRKLTGLRRWCLAATSLAMLSLSGGAGAASTDFPNRPITFITPTAAGGGVDVVTRALAEAVSPLLGQPVIVSNKPGAGGVIGTQSAMREKNDGHALLVTANNNQLIVPWLYKSAGFDPLVDFEPVATVGSVPFVLTVNPSFPAQDLAGFLTLIRDKPNEYRYASAGNGTLNHMLPELLAQQVGGALEHVPYRGVAPALTDVIGGQVSVLFGTVPSLIENIRSGRLRALGVASAERSKILPEVPAINEQVPGFTNDMWVAVYAPKGTPQPVIAQLSDAILKAMDNPRLRESFDKMGMQVLQEGPHALAERQAAELQVWKDVVAKSGLTAE